MNLNIDLLDIIFWFTVDYYATTYENDSVVIYNMYTNKFVEILDCKENRYYYCKRYYKKSIDYRISIEENNIFLQVDRMLPNNCSFTNLYRKIESRYSPIKIKTTAKEKNFLLEK